MLMRKLMPLLLLAGCGATTVSSTPQAPPQPQLAQQLVDSTALRRPLHLVFAWSFTEENARFSGRGSTRVEPAYKARLDLFGPRGETYLSAAAVGDELRLPPNLPAALAAIMPPTPLMWSALGVLRAPDGAHLEMTHQSGDTLTVGYGRGEEHWRFRSIRGRLQYAEWNGPNAGRRTVELRGDGGHRLPAVAVFRDWQAFRELTMTLEQANEAAPFPPDTWYPGT
jgi:hypothetical protein